MRHKAIAAAGSAALLLVLSAAAQAQQVSVADDTGDTEAPGLDITSLTVRNRDHAVVTRVTFSRDRPGKVIVFVKPRDGRLVVVYSQHRRQGPDRTFVVGGTGVCPGLSSDWDRSAATVKLRLPSQCLLGGNYGAVRAQVLIEGLHSGADVDTAPEKPNEEPTYTAWMPRG